ncbi:hypothetical protein [Enterococcus sp. CWB-B31]|uniref:hypothetical protein n=1 Tax=Enterococcus sp. CWB-B31 TaxID=2885159 RepID=UPI001E3B3072|nr:hypothetical protein [Enterococcus sp. CWB-B31]MCB5954150.1 hypothetical protein [Enterococcus sp. CWB-B31]
MAQSDNKCKDRKEKAESQACTKNDSEREEKKLVVITKSTGSHGGTVRGIEN